VFTPTEIDGSWYSDGGILDNFPVGPLEGCCDTILGVYATPLKVIHQADLHSSLAVSLRAFEVGMYLASKAKFPRCASVLCPEELSRFGTFDTRHFDEILDAGYRGARERMGEILRALDGAGSA
jgi:NTE family protein